jgi:hypothetical protein
VGGAVAGVPRSLRFRCWRAGGSACGASRPGGAVRPTMSRGSLGLWAWWVGVWPRRVDGAPRGGRGAPAAARGCGPVLVLAAACRGCCATAARRVGGRRAQGVPPVVRLMRAQGDRAREHLERAVAERGARTACSAPRARFFAWMVVLIAPGGLSLARGHAALAAALGRFRDWRLPDGAIWVFLLGMGCSWPGHRGPTAWTLCSTRCSVLCSGHRGRRIVGAQGILPDRAHDVVRFAVAIYIHAHHRRGWSGRCVAGPPAGAVEDKEAQ